MKKLAGMTASLVLKGLQKEKSLDHTDEDYIDSKEAAALLGLTPNYLRSQKDKYPHIKVGISKLGTPTKDEFYLSVLSCLHTT
jgi:hypothetical protein